MSFDLERFNVEIFLFLFDFILYFLNDLINQIINMCSSFWSTDSIYKWNLFELSISDRNNYLPSLCIDLLIKYFCRGWIFLEIQVNILWKRFDINLLIVELNSYFWKNSSHIINSFGHQSNYILIKSVWHIEEFKTREKCDLNKILTRIWSYFSFIMDFHIVFPSHFKLLFILWITTFYDKFVWKDICQFSAITISPTNNSFFIIVVVATSQ